MSSDALSPALLDSLRAIFGDAVLQDAPLSSHVTARTGGSADAIVTVESADQLAQAAQMLWQAQAPFHVLGSGSNVLVADQGVRGVVILNRAKVIHFALEGDAPSVWVESGANLSSLARQAALQGFGGLEWAAAIPGTVGGAVYGNAGAFGGDMRDNLIVADILHPEGLSSYTVDQMEYGYRSSILKQQHATHAGAPQAVILSARLNLKRGDALQIQEQISANIAHRRQTQPPGASMGSMFKNPPGDYAGRLIEAAGLKGTSRGGAQISPVHGNFIINRNDATAQDISDLICLAQDTVRERFGIQLELEVEPLGEWQSSSTARLGDHKNA